MSNFRFFLVIFLMFSTVEGKKSSKLKPMRRPGSGLLFRDISECRDVAGNALKLRNLTTVITEKGVYVVKGDVILTRTFDTISDISVIMTRCASEVDFQSCELFQILKIPEPCKVLTNSNSPFFTNIINSSKPKLMCPFNHTRYTLDCWMDVKTISMLVSGAAGYYWQIRIEFFANGTLQGCGEFSSYMDYLS